VLRSPSRDLIGSRHVPRLPIKSAAAVQPRAARGNARWFCSVRGWHSPARDLQSLHGTLQAQRRPARITDVFFTLQRERIRPRCAYTVLHSTQQWVKCPSSQRNTCALAPGTPCLTNQQRALHHPAHHPAQTTVFSWLMCPVSRLVSYLTSPLLHPTFSICSVHTIAIS